jgi:transposase
VRKKVAEAEDALGRSRGGYTTKVHLACTDEDTAVAVELTPGQAGDAPQFDGLFEAACERVPQTDEVVADKGYDSQAIRQRALAVDVAAQIPSKRNAVDPWPVLAESYRQRNRVERLVNKMKQFRGIATRYDKLAASFLATIKTVLSFIKLRSFVNRT